jgi:hypothetical protein
VALFNASSSLYTIWNTDGSGNVLSASLANVSGTSTALESAEVSFQQDLNHDGTIGIPGQSSAAQVASVATATLPTAASAPPASAGSDAFTFRADLGNATAPSSVTATAPPQVGGLIAPAATPAGAELQHIFADAVHELIGSHDGLANGLLVDLAHGFIIH